MPEAWKSGLIIPLFKNILRGILSERMNECTQKNRQINTRMDFKQAFDTVKRLLKDNLVNKNDANGF